MRRFLKLVELPVQLSELSVLGTKHLSIFLISQLEGQAFSSGIFIKLLDVTLCF